MADAVFKKFSAWADEAGMTKVMPMYDMMGRERERCTALAKEMGH